MTSLSQVAPCANAGPSLPDAFRWPWQCFQSLGGEFIAMMMMMMMAMLIIIISIILIIVTIIVNIHVLIKIIVNITILVVILQEECDSHSKVPVPQLALCIEPRLWSASIGPRWPR